MTEAEELNAASDLLGAAIAQAEETFAKLGLKVYCSVPIDPAHPHRQLAYSRRNGGWRLVLIDAEKTDLSTATRDERIEALPALPRLHAALVKRSSELLGELRGVLIDTDNFLKSISPKEGA
jgi:hypothetical protein